ncbi:solute carrier family 25 member 36-A-like isoform X2 [Lineus longissimus]|uniref:solute carrier family 25 member 36-A-like isoform X2 n=1 Tax=Lineus longissimus TaxID=88925 RepID=UPI002B4F5F85
MDATVVHLLAGGAGGTVGAIVTCPLEVVKTRLQSSFATKFTQQVYVPSVANVPSHHVVNLSTCSGPAQTWVPTNTCSTRNRPTTGLVQCFKHIIQNEGMSALWKGLGPNLIGVAPSRAIYFYSYAKAKSFCNRLTVLTPESPLVHICAACFAGFSACTTTNPIWFIKTRLQLDQKAKGSLSVSECIKDIYQESGLRGFYKGISASYFGISETIIHFVIYEAVKAKLLEFRGASCSDDERCAGDFFRFMMAGAISKTCASVIAYPHEVVRTRLREEGSKYKGFMQTLRTVFLEEGYRGLYRGLATQMVRQIPNTALMMSTYEGVVYLFSKSSSNDDDDDDDY